MKEGFSTETEEPFPETAREVISSRSRHALTSPRENNDVRNQLEGSGRAGP